MRNRVQTDLPAHRGRGVPADFCRQRMRCFMARRGKEKNDIRDEPHHQHFGCQIIHMYFSLETPPTESKRPPGNPQGFRAGKNGLFFSRHFVYVSLNTCVGRLPWCAEELWIEG